MSKKFRFWSDKFMAEMSNLKFWLLSGVEHPPAIFTGTGGMHQIPRLSSSCIIASTQVKMPLKPRICIPASAYPQHMATWGQTSRWKWRKSVAQKFPNTGNISRWMPIFFHFSSTMVCNYAKLKLSWWVPWLVSNRHNKLSKIMACSTVNTNIDTYGFLNTPSQVPWKDSRTVTGSSWAFSARSDHWSSPTPVPQCQPCHMVGTQYVSGEWNEMTNNAVET